MEVKDVSRVGKDSYRFKAVVTFKLIYNRRDVKKIALGLGPHMQTKNCDRKLGGAWGQGIWGHITLFVHASSSSLLFCVHTSFMCAVREGQGSGGSWEGATEYMEVNQPRGMPQHS